MAMQLSDVQVGKQYRIKQNFGSGPTVTGTVTNVEADIKKGFPGVDYVVNGGVDDGEGHWAYLEHVSPL